ncbi:hypothetical protein H2198_001637 [Neophaeococcomyces mojaviensis]|uniref:Uncharacterized protein n=1 Tax=Neophaeococcomyces mojaviensis TaxID=3383035 RepID=A0ACC3AH76_9EURO|nr:hypothetical protein H2198_001637 [Knufia sp. JES_112]
MNAALDETLPLSDPRRFTPTLHASLVSEILSLRRDVENKTNDIEKLEQSLHNAQSQNEQLNANLLTTNRDTRQLKRQMQILEGGTLSAINELAKERDDALNDLSEMRKRFEQSQKKVKIQEDNVDRVQEQWQRDKEAWLTERRSLDTKIHIVEGRLKVVLSEVAKAQQLSDESHQTPRRSQSRQSILGSPTKRPTSVAARRYSGNSIISDQVGGRASVLSFTYGDHTNLADELALEDIDEDYTSQPEDGRISPDALPEEQPRPSSRISSKARKVLGLPADLSELELPERYTPVEPLSSLAEVGPPKERLQPFYVDSGVQYSPPPSPVMERLLETPVPRNRESMDTARASKILSIISEGSANYSVDTSDNAWEEILRNQPIMVSSGCQTVEQMPSFTTKSEAQLETIAEINETREIAIQTDSPPIRAPVPIRFNHYRTDTLQTSASTDTTELQIPAIAIIPPTSRPVTPEQLTVKLPPRTKNAGCQVETHLLCDYNSKGMQTEDIRIDKRSMIPHPTIPPPPIPTNPPPPSSFLKGKNSIFARRNAPNAANSSIRRSAASLAPINDDGPLSDGSKLDMARPVRSSSMFAGFDEADELDDFDDVFHDDDFLNRPMAKLILSRGKLLTSDNTLDDIEESDAVRAGRQFALDNIRRSEDGMHPDLKELESDAEPLPKLPKRQSSKQIKRVPSSKSTNMRRAALISSGTAAHQSKQSESSLGSGDSTRPPPMPIPVRYSSARIGKSISDGGRSSRGSSNASPTRNVRRVAKPSLRKARSGPAMSPAPSAARKARSRSPPLETRVSIVPDMPNFTMPQEQRVLKPAISMASVRYEASAPRPSIAQGPNRPTSHVKTNSDAFEVQQTSVVDAIAQTMVGEWMFKYVRRRKSFGKPDKEWDPMKSVDELTSSSSSGVRHKRWVWLAPYERSVMWSSKQPTDGTSLLGKSGRKLTIKSVLDVKDDNPMPKGSAPGPHFNRSILILTPQRALKFTATTQERHYIWLTALSFLSHSPISMTDLAPAPPMPPEDHGVIDTSPAASLGGSLRRRPIRDSIRIAKGSARQPTFRSFTADGILTTTTDYERPQTQEQYDPINDAAMPPVVKRYHNRKRSNTAPKPTASAFRAFLMRDPAPPPTAAPSVAVTSEKASTDRGPLTPSLDVPSMPSSRRGSEASVAGLPPLPNLDLSTKFFDTTSNSSHAASMTMRMDAFMAEQQRNARGPPGRGPLRNLRLGRPSMRNLRDPMTSSWVQSEENARNSMSPVDMNALTTPTEFRFSESTTRGSSEVGEGYFKRF